VKAVDLEVERRQTDGVIHHSEQGSPFKSIEFAKWCREANVRPSMGTVGDCYDNALCKSFFASLECELIDRREFTDRNEAQREVFSYVDRFSIPHADIRRSTTDRQGTTNCR